MQAVIMAGGKGTRLQSIASDIPKPMVPVVGKPILEHQIESLRTSGITEITIIVGYLGTAIRDYFSNGEAWNVNIEYIQEELPLGTAGALYYLKQKIKEDFFLVFGDLLLDIDWKRFMTFHQSHGAAITLFGHPNAHPYDSDLIVVEKNGQVLGIEPKNLPRDFYYQNFVNAGIYCVSPMVLDYVEVPEKLDFEKSIVARLIPHERVYAYASTEYVKDMGTPDRYHAVSRDLEHGIVAARRLTNKQKCIFLDRDGTININKGFLASAEEFELLPGVAEAISLANKSEYLVIVATNQPVVARGECTVAELDRIHRKMETELGKQGAYIDGLYYCPHHPHKGFKGEIPELKFDCQCRKPKIGMLVQAAQEHNIDLRESWYIGDTTVDIQTGKNAGVRSILLKTGEAGRDGKYDAIPDEVSENLLEAIKLILKK